MGRSIAAIITTLDNLPLLKEQIQVLRRDEFVSKVIVVSNGSQDGTNEWLAKQSDLISVVRDNLGAGPGRNAGLNAAGNVDYYLMLDGGIRPLIGGTQRLLEFLERRADVDVLGVEIPHFETDREKAWRRWVSPITDSDTYQNSRLSQTAYCLARNQAFNPYRFCEEGPFGQPGWGADDDEMAYRWREADITVHAVTNIHPYRRGSGSFRRLFLETGVWPNQYGSVYEQRLVWLQQNWPQYQPGAQWGEPWLTVVVKVGDLEKTVKLLKLTHDRLRQRRFAPPYNNAWNPYHIIAWTPDKNQEFLNWSESFRLRQHHGDTTIIDGSIVKRKEYDESLWVGDFIVSVAPDWQMSVRSSAHYYTLIDCENDLDIAIKNYDAVHPKQDTNNAPNETYRRLDNGRV
jgi:hypothetical protein